MLKQILAAAALVVAASAAFASDASADRRQLAPAAQATQAGNPAPAQAPCSCCRR